MAKRAFVTDDSSIAAQPNGDVILGLTVWFYEEENGELIGATDLFLPVAVTIEPGLNSAQMNAAIPAAVKAVALASLGWTMAPNTVVHKSMNRG